jgi:hypothetical protein
MSGAFVVTTERWERDKVALGRLLAHGCRDGPGPM